MDGFHFTERARRALAMGREESARLHHEYVGTEHIVLGLLRDPESMSTDILRGCQIDPSAVVDEIERVVQRGKPGAVSGADLPYTSRVKRVFELAMSEARARNHSSIGTGHALIGLLLEEKGLGAQALHSAGLRLDEARQQMTVLLGERGAGRGEDG